jgi:hypothetical protein
MIEGVMTRNPQQVYWVTVAVWALFMAGHMAWYVRQALAALPTDEVYANALGFQLVAFGLTRLPLWLLGLIALLLAEFVLFRRR